MGGGWSAPRPGRFTPGKDPVPVVQEAGWASETVWTGAENFAPIGIRSPGRPARSESLHQLSYPVSLLDFSIILVLWLALCLPSCAWWRIPSDEMQSLDNAKTLKSFLLNVDTKPVMQGRIVHCSTGIGFCLAEVSRPASRVNFLVFRPMSFMSKISNWRDLKGYASMRSWV